MLEVTSAAGQSGRGRVTVKYISGLFGCWSNFTWDWQFKHGSIKSSEYTEQFLQPSNTFLLVTMPPLILHNVPDDELYVGEDGVQRPYAMIFPG